MKPTIEELVSKSFKTYKEKRNSEAFFYVSEIKKAYPDCVIEDADIRTFSINSKRVKCVRLGNVKFAEKNNQ